MSINLGKPEWMYTRYLATDIKKMSEKSTLCKEVFCCAYREYDEQKGSTGGPGGVLHMQEVLLGKRFKNIKLNYIFKPLDYRVPDVVWNEMKQLDFKVKTVIAGAGYILSNSLIAVSIEKGNAPILICHDMGTAYGAYLLGVKYILIYHQQGSILNEIVSCGVDYTPADEEIMSYIEKCVVSNAYKVYFPSKGARKVYLDTTLAQFDDQDIANLSDTPLYNTISEAVHIKNVNSILDRWNIEIDELADIFISVGDYNKDKGLDRIPTFLEVYKKNTNRNVIWIAVGNNTMADIVSSIRTECKQKNVKCYLIPERIEHDDLLTLLGLADYYIMLHRKSIFDLATLEAMRSGKKLILSDCEANREFNVLDNVVLVSEDMKDAIEQAVRKGKLDWSHSNRRAFASCFDNRAFIRRYADMLKEILLMYGLQERQESRVNQENLSEWKDRYKGKKCIICGSGHSLDSIQKQEKDCIYIALNKALFYTKIHFDFLFMQDMPYNQAYTLEDYNEYDCVKFYGIITNREMKVEGLGKENAVFINKVNRILRYELSPTVFDYRVDEYEYDIANKCIIDAQSVLFSALQFALYAGFTNIQLCGVDFSNINYGNTENPSKYAVNVCRNLIELKRQWKEKYKNVQLHFYNTTNQYLNEAFYEIDNRDTTVIVSGIYTQSYMNLVKLQEQSCCDRYLFDFRYITDEEWNLNKSSSEFAFLGGNTIKVQVVIDKIKENFGNVIIITDADVVFLRKTRGRIFQELEDVDMLFLRERGKKEKLYEKAIENVNIGFVVIKCNEHSLAFWRQVLKRTIDEKGWDQEIVNKVLHEKQTNCKWKLLSEEFHNGGSITSANFESQRICTSCGTIAKRLGLTKEEFLTEAFQRYQSKKWFETK